MNFRSLPLKLAVAVMALFIAVPTFATPKRRAVGGTQPEARIKLTGVVVDAESGRPVVFADVANGDIRTVTDAQGKFELLVPSGRATSLTVGRSGYDTLVYNVPNGATSVTIQLRGRSGVRVRTTKGETFELDYETAQFAYLIPFSGYARSDAGKFCRQGQQSYRPDKSTIARVVGPATTANFAACCTLGETLKIQLVLKSGETTDVYFTDACFGYEVDFVGRDHVSGEFVFLKFTEIAEITFP